MNAIEGEEGEGYRRYAERRCYLSHRWRHFCSWWDVRSYSGDTVDGDRAIGHRRRASAATISSVNLAPVQDAPQWRLPAVQLSLDIVGQEAGLSLSREADLPRRQFYQGVPESRTRKRTTTRLCLNLHLPPRTSWHH